MTKKEQNAYANQAAPDVASRLVCYGIEPDTGVPILIDRTSLPSSCEFLCSTFEREMLEHEIRQIRDIYPQDEIIILDSLAHHRAFCKELGGQIISVYQDPNVFLNPFDVPVTLDIDKAADFEMWVHHKQLLMIAFMEIAVGKLTAEEEKVICEATELACENAMFATDIWMDADGSYCEGHPLPTLKDFDDQLRNEIALDFVRIRFKLEQLAYEWTPRLSTTLGAYAERTNVAIKNKLISYDFYNSDDRYMPIGAVWLGMLVCLEQIRNRAIANAARNARTWVFIDDVSLLCQRSMSAGLLLSFCKEARMLNCYPTFGFLDAWWLNSDRGHFPADGFQVETALLKNSSLVRATGEDRRYRRFAELMHWPIEYESQICDYRSEDVYGIVQCGAETKTFFFRGDELVASEDIQPEL